MKCLKCHVVNRAGRRFCGSCGSALSIACPACGFENDASDLFCGGCGAALSSAEGAIAPPVTSARKHADPVVDDLPIEGSRRQLTIMFCDLVGSTSISDRVDPEEMIQLFGAYRDACTDVVKRYGGYVGHFMGDGLLIYFGYPQAHEDDPQRAIQAALSIISAVHKLKMGPDFSDPDLQLDVRIGINTGLVVAAEIGTGEQREKMSIVGDTPNIAARLQALAEPGTVVIGSKTYRLVEGLFECDILGPKKLKGISDPVVVYRVRQSTKARTRLEVKLQSGLTPLAGRKEEMRILGNRWDQAQAGDGQVVLVSGEPGVGKSRILQSFQSHVDDENCPVVTLVCSSYRRDTPFHPIIDFFERNLTADLDSDAPVDLTLDALDQFLADIGLDVDVYAPLIAAMLSLPVTGRYTTANLTLADQKNETLKALIEIAVALSKELPLLIVVEDIQWADHSTLEFLGLLFEKVRTSRILVVLAHRADYYPTWAQEPHLTDIRLKNLSRASSVELIDGVTGGTRLPQEVLDHILAKTDGVPLFIEELTKLVLEMDLVTIRDGRYELTGSLRNTVIPDSLQDSLMARLDRLGTAKEAAQLASVLGRTFGHALLLAISDKGEEALDQALTRLVDSELLYRRGLASEIVYEFKHALVKDAAYQGLLLSKRRKLHLEIAETLENRFPQTAGRSPELLSHHYQEAGRIEQAVPFSFNAGDTAAQRYASTEASAHYQSALDMAKQMPVPEESARYQIKAILKLANVALTREECERNLGNLDHAQALAKKYDNRPRLCQIQYWMGRTYYVLGQFNRASEFALQALEIADTFAEGETIRNGPVNLLARVNCLVGKPVAAITYATESVKQMRDVGDRVEEAAVSGVLAFAHAQHGQFSEALKAADHGVTIAQDVDHLPTIAASLMFRGVVFGWFGKLEQAVPDFEKALYVCEKSGDVFRKYLTLGWQGEAYLAAGETTAARNSLDQCLELGSTLGTTFHRGAFQAFLASSLLADGDFEDAQSTSEAAIKTAKEAGEAWPLSIALRVSAKVQLSSPEVDIENAKACVKEALEIQQERQCDCDIAWTKLIEGHVLERAGQPQEARKVYDETARMFDELGIERGTRLTATALADAER